jgi:hypothetical protein
MSPAAPSALVWLDRHVRAPLEGSAIERWLLAPAKDLYLRLAWDRKRE